MTVLVLKSPSFVEITDIQTGNVQKITYQDALGKWTGYIISIKEKSVVTQAPNVCIKGEYSKKFLVGVISMFLISSFLFILFLSHTSIGHCTTIDRHNWKFYIMAIVTDFFGIL